MAFLDRDEVPGAATEVRAWDLTLAQVLGIVGQEARLAEDPDPSVVDELAPGATLALGGGWYDTLLRLDDVAGTVALTVTTAQDLPLTRPTDAYLATIAAGRAERAGPGRARGSAR